MFAGAGEARGPNDGAGPFGAAFSIESRSALDSCTIKTVSFKKLVYEETLCFAGEAML